MSSIINKSNKFMRHFSDDFKSSRFKSLLGYDGLKRFRSNNICRYEYTQMTNFVTDIVEMHKKSVCNSEFKNAFNEILEYIKINNPNYDLNTIKSSLCSKVAVKDLDMARMFSDIRDKIKPAEYNFNTLNTLYTLDNHIESLLMGLGISNNIELSNTPDSIKIALLNSGQFWYGVKQYENHNIQYPMSWLQHFQSNLVPKPVLNLYKYDMQYPEIIFNPIEPIYYESYSYVVFGYALYPDGVWRKNIWNINKMAGIERGNRELIIHNISTKPLLYYGTVLTLSEILELAYEYLNNSSKI